MGLSISPQYQVSQSLAQNFNLQQIAGTIASKAGTITGTAGFGSSLFLQRIMIPGAMNLSEIDIALQVQFPATSQGAGTMSRSFGLFSIKNSTSLSLLFSASGSSAWQTGTSTTAGAASLTMFQGGWSTPLIQPMTFNASTFSGGDYVVGQIFDFAQASSTWTLNLFGANAASSALASAATNLTSATLGAMSSGGLLAGSVFTASGSSALTAFTATPTGASVMLSAALLAASAHTASSSSSLTAWSAAPTVVNALSSSGLVSLGSVRFWSHSNVTGGQTLGASATAGALSGLSSAITVTLTTLFTSRSHFSATGSGIALSNAGTSAFAGFLGSGGLIGGSFFTAATGSSAVLANAGTAAAAVMGSAGLLAGSFFTASGSISAVTNVALGALNSTTLAQTALPNFGYIGTGSTTSNYPSAFIAGVMSTGAIPANITLTSSAVTYSGSPAFQQPWFALIGQ